jgi:hypothetical protein
MSKDQRRGVLTLTWSQLQQLEARLGLTISAIDVTCYGDAEHMYVIDDPVWRCGYCGLLALKDQCAACLAPRNSEAAYRLAGGHTT